MASVPGIGHGHAHGVRMDAAMGGVGAGVDAEDGGVEASNDGGSSFHGHMSLDLDLEGYGPPVDDPSTFLRQAAAPHHHEQEQTHHDRPQQQQQQHAPLPGGTFGRLPAAQPQQHPSGGGQFGILAPPAAAQVTFAGGAHGNGQPSGGQIVPDPPDLEAWRDKLFHVDEMIVLTDEQYETYFPHVDNVYSHRSTQRYKRKPFVSHYWDCRMKGRPPGTPKSDDPNKKKRKRLARERDLCDVKIKITEYAPGAQIQLEPTPGSANGGSADPASFMAPPLEIGPGERFWTIQRVNGNGGNGKGDGVAGPHRHTLAKSDEIKKSSVQRYLATQERETKKKGPKQPAQRRASGAALTTVKRHSKDSDLKLYAACFCPYSQRVWIALEAKGIAYQYHEVDPYRRPLSTQLLEANPRGLVPAIRQGSWACAESAILLEYLEDTDGRVPLYPTDPRLKANCRLWIDHVNSFIVPPFFGLLQLANGGDMALRARTVNRLQSAVSSLVHAADEQGPFFLGSSLSIVDVHFAPFAIRLSRILGPLHDWAEPAPGTRWQRWLQALEDDVHVKATTSAPELYVETAHLLAQKLPGGQG